MTLSKTKSPIAPMQNSKACDECDGWGNVDIQDTFDHAASPTQGVCGACDAGEVPVHICAFCDDSKLIGGAYRVNGECLCADCAEYYEYDLDDLEMLVRPSLATRVLNEIARMGCKPVFDASGKFLLEV